MVIWRTCQPLREAVSWNILITSHLLGVYRQPLREAVSWNMWYTEQRPTRNDVSLFVRLWVEIRQLLPYLEELTVSLFVRLWVEMTIATASSFVIPVSLFVRLWVEIIRSLESGQKRQSQPLREAVSWNTLAKKSLRDIVCQPLREAVSWNTDSPYDRMACGNVSLFVRLWVEIYICLKSIRIVFSQPLREAVSWNGYAAMVESANARQPLREAVSWNSNRLHIREVEDESASSWGCELKCYWQVCHQRKSCQPLREAVSWNMMRRRRQTSFHHVSLFVRLWVEIRSQDSCLSEASSASSWGCELKYVHHPPYAWSFRQPLREAVSWNRFMGPYWKRKVWSASSWGCELKCIRL